MLRDERGITLLELMVALVITALLGLAIYNVCKMAMDAWQKGEARTQVYQNLRIALERMSDEIRSAITLDSTYNPAPKDIYFYGQDTYDGTHPEWGDRLDFISIAHPPIGNYYDSDFNNDELVFDCCEIGYRVSGTTIYRRKQEKNVPDSDITGGGSEKELATHITNLGFRYYNGSSWQDTWDAETEGTLPEIVEISLTAKSDIARYENERTFTTYVSLSGR